jgi:RimJ/RimL family protein N-acetyltransferase
MIFRQAILDDLPTLERFEQGVTDFYLDVYADNPSAIRAYEKLGFKPNLVEMKMSL